MWVYLKLTSFADPATLARSPSLAILAQALLPLYKACKLPATPAKVPKVVIMRRNFHVLQTRKTTNS